MAEDKNGNYVPLDLEELRLQTHKLAIEPPEAYTGYFTNRHRGDSDARSRASHAPRSVRRYRPSSEDGRVLEEARRPARLQRRRGRSGLWLSR